MEFTRAFYALGLVIAGFISDWNRKYGAICCIAALVFPFAMLVLLADVGTSVILWIIGYVFFGFFVVYRVIVFVDLAGKCESNLFLAGVGLMFGRAGGCDGGNPWYLSCKSNIASCDSGGDCFCCNNICIFYFLSKNVFSDFVRRNEELLLEDFTQEYGLSPREKEVFSLIKEGRSNSEIASDLYISENTVKFHIKNILKKTACVNRTELIILFKNH